jgi:hypothetical protein
MITMGRVAASEQRNDVNNLVVIDLMTLSFGLTPICCPSQRACVLYMSLVFP